MGLDSKKEEGNELIYSDSKISKRLKLIFTSRKILRGVFYYLFSIKHVDDIIYLKVLRIKLKRKFKR